MGTIYDVDYFIRKFESIPSTDIGSHSISNHCAYWHCGVGVSLSATNEAIAFGKLMKQFDNKYDKPNAYAEGLHWGAIWLNDGCVKEYNQASPKQRILAALYDIKAIQNKKPLYENITKTLAVLPIEETTDVKIKIHTPIH